MAELSASFQAQLKTLRDAFASDLYAQLDDLEGTWGDPRKPEAERLRDLHLRAHRLSEAATIFGFAEMGQVLHTLELHLSAALTGDEPFRPGEFQTLLEAARTLSSRAAESRDLGNEDGVPETMTTSIFVLEADPFTARGFEDQLGSFGYHVRAFHTMKALLEALACESPAILVVDAEAAPGLPIDIAPLQEFQAARTRVIPVIFLSDRTDLESRLQAVRAGGRAYLPKPPDILMLTELLDEIVNVQPGSPYEVLIVEDDAQQAEQHAAVLQRAGFRTTVVGDPLKVMEPLEEGAPDLVLMDVHLPGCSGVELAAVIHQQEAFLGIPIVFLSREGPMDSQLEALRSGGDDFLFKPIEPWHLVSVVTTRAQRGRTLRGRMVRDSLTGLLNHATIMGDLALEVARIRRAPGPLSFAMVDLDHFKRVNEAFGHAAGDRVIRGLARMMQQRLRRTDIIGRYGGEEIAVILPGAEGEAAYAIMKRLCEAFGRISFPFSPEGLHVTLSCGVAAWSSCLDEEGLAATADRALAEAKRRGRNRVILAP